MEEKVDYQKLWNSIFSWVLL